MLEGIDDLTLLSHLHEPAGKFRIEGFHSGSLHTGPRAAGRPEKAVD